MLCRSFDERRFKERVRRFYQYNTTSLLML